MIVRGALKEAYIKASTVAEDGVRPQIDQVVEPHSRGYRSEVSSYWENNFSFIVQRRDSPHRFQPAQNKARVDITCMLLKPW